jgi:3-phenylpropionate/trans-cinnamate dioxygenase ferredoxin reductase component
VRCGLTPSIQRVGEPRKTDILLIGGGVASVRCARTLRREGFEGRITLVGDEPSPPYNRPPLSKELLRDDLPDDLVLAEPISWYERRSVDLETNRRVAAIDLDAGVATFEDGARIAFERCLLATGARPRELPVDGGSKAILLRILADARRIRATAVKAGTDARVTVVGGGFIGVEVASGLAALGLRPTIIELGDRLWAGLLGDELDRWARDRLARAGIEVRAGGAVSRLSDDAAWIGDERHAHAFSVAGIGVTPRTELAEAAGLAVDDGIVTDGEHRTSHPAAWAAGDVARVGGRRIEHWHAAREGGERAALSMLGRPVPAARAPWVFSEVAGHLIDVVGWAPSWDEATVIGDENADRFAVAYLIDGRVAQLAVVNSALPVEDARAFVERAPSARELAVLGEASAV